jgi:hypothetical protein
VLFATFVCGPNSAIFCNPNYVPFISIAYSLTRSAKLQKSCKKVAKWAATKVAGNCTLDFAANCALAFAIIWPLQQGSFPLCREFPFAEQLLDELRVL